MDYISVAVCKWIRISVFHFLVQHCSEIFALCSRCRLLCCGAYFVNLSLSVVSAKYLFQYSICRKFFCQVHFVMLCLQIAFVMLLSRVIGKIDKEETELKNKVYIGFCNPGLLELNGWKSNINWTPFHKFNDESGTTGVKTIHGSVHKSSSLVLYVCGTRYMLIAKMVPGICLNNISNSHAGKEHSFSLQRNFLFMQQSISVALSIYSTTKFSFFPNKFLDYAFSLA